MKKIFCYFIIVLSLFVFISCGKLPNPYSVSDYPARVTYFCSSQYLKEDITDRLSYIKDVVMINTDDSIFSRFGFIEIYVTENNDSLYLDVYPTNEHYKKHYFIKCKK